MKKFLTPLFLLALAAVILPGCNSSHNIITVGLKIELASLERAGDGTVQVTWRVSNPNLASYLLSQTSHRIFLNGTLVGKTMDNDPMGVPAQFSTTKTSKLLLADQAAERVLRDALAAGSARYRVESQITVRLYGDTVDRSSLINSGTVLVTGK